jgi:very-short-patch-repair endonuclease
MTWLNRVIRFANDDVLHNLDAVVEKIRKELNGK